MSHYRYFECTGSLSLPQYTDLKPTTHEIMDILESNHIFCIFAPAQCTNHLQPVDVSINKAAKDHIRQQFQSSYTDQVRMKLDHSIEPENVKVDTKIAVIKTPSAKWLVAIHLRSKPEIIVNGSRKAGIKKTQQTKWFQRVMKTHLLTWVIDSVSCMYMYCIVMEKVHDVTLTRMQYNFNWLYNYSSQFFLI